METTARAPGLFEGTAWYYSRFRSRYPDEALKTLVTRFHLDRSTHVLDLGCGTGQISIPLAALGVSVYGIDPDVEMLAEGIRAEHRAGVHGVAWMRGDDKSLEQLPLPPLSLVTMGASFHWMDRDEVLKKLDRKIVSGGGVAVLSGGTSVWSEEMPSWNEVVKDVIVQFLGPQRRAGGGTYTHPADRHQTVLARSPFSRVESFTFQRREELTVDDIVGAQLSTSYASPAQLQNRTDEFKQVLQSRLLQLEPSGIFPSKETTEVLIATR